MQSYLVSYAHENGFGRKLIGREGPIDEDTITDLEKLCAKAARSNNAVILGIFPIDGPITPKSN